MQPRRWIGAATIPVALMIAGCFIDRRGGLIGDAGQTPRADGGRPIDAGPPGPVDSGPPPVDIGPPPPPCVETCTLGSYCLEGTCQCPGAAYCCSGCGPGQFCFTETNTCRCMPGDCRCTMPPCPTGQMCQPDGSCAVTPPPSCGADGEPCCPTSTQCDSMWLYCSGSSCRQCGGRLQPCCPGNRCMGGLSCSDLFDTCYG